MLLLRRREARDIIHQQWWNRIFPDAECITIEGAAGAIAALDAGLVSELMVEFIIGERMAAPSQRSLVAVLFTDLVDSTPTAAARGDAVWRSTLDSYEASLRRTIERHHGTVVKHTGDGALATFPSGSEFIAVAVDFAPHLVTLGLERRPGVHVGEVEQPTTTSAARRQARRPCRRRSGPRRDPHVLGNRADRTSAADPVGGCRPTRRSKASRETWQLVIIDV